MAQTPSGDALRAGPTRPDESTATGLPPVPWRTWANLATAVRTVAALVLGMIAVADGSLTLLAIAYGVYWVGDSLDGNLARFFHQETRFGAVFDIVCDRANSSILAVGLVSLRPHDALPIGIYLSQFMVIDLLLTLSFLHWPLVSPNYFYKVDRLVWRLNWSIPAKTANTTLLILLLLFAPVWLVTIVAIAQLAVKAGSMLRVHRLLALSGRDPQLGY